MIEAVAGLIAIAYAVIAFIVAKTLLLGGIAIVGLVGWIIYAICKEASDSAEKKRSHERYKAMPTDALAELMAHDYAVGYSDSMVASRYGMTTAKVRELLTFDAKTAPKPPKREYPVIIPFDVEWDKVEWWARCVRPTDSEFVWHGHRLRKTEDGKLKATVRPIASMTPTQRLRQRRRAV